MAVYKPHEGMFQRFLHSQVGGSFVLIAATIVALIWANSPWSQSYYDISHTYAGVSWGDASFKLSLSHWIKDGLMAIFFFVVGLEIKREVIAGELSSLNRAMLPVAAAIGGALVPAAIYAWLNAGGPGAPGWGIPMATDIAFALGVLSLFGKRVPLGLKVFLTALAIVDDLLAVIVIAVFYTPDLEGSNLLFAFVPLVAMVAANRIGVRATWVYTLLAIAVWVSVLGSGVHATIAGVLVAMAIPVRPRLDPNTFVDISRRNIEKLTASALSADSLIHNRAQRETLEDLILAAEDAIPPGIALENRLHPVQAFVILPLFALFSAGVSIDADSVRTLSDGIGLGILAGLVLGKPAGILLATFLIVKLAGLRLEGVDFGQFLGAGCLAGIGFTMSIFISELAFTDEALIGQAKMGILAASVLSGVAGFLILSRTLPRP